MCNHDSVPWRHVENPVLRKSVDVNFTPSLRTFNAICLTKFNPARSKQPTRASPWTAGGSTSCMGSEPWKVHSTALNCNAHIHGRHSSLQRLPQDLICRKDFFFFLDAAWLNEGRCPGGRPSCQRKLRIKSQIH